MQIYIQDNLLVKEFRGRVLEIYYGIYEEDIC